MSQEKHLRCSFCGKSKDSVRKFISGPSVYICNECITLCNEILAEDEEREVARRLPGAADYPAAERETTHRWCTRCWYEIQSGPLDT